jgi:hypothetical protein
MCFLLADNGGCSEEKVVHIVREDAVNEADAVEVC